MASGHGTGTLDFGAFPGSNEASVSVTGLTGISGTSKAEAYFMASDTTSDHTAADHRYAAALIGLTCATPSGSACTVYGRCVEAMQGTFSIRLVWAD
jgi:hypothetical protein